MQSHDADRFVKMVSMLGVNYDKPVTKERLEVWFGVLAEYDIEQLEAAAIAHMKSSKFMPTPADLIERLSPDAQQSALIAWAEVPLLLRNSRAAKSANPITEKVVQDLGGWFALGQKTTAELVWVAKEFAQRYATYSELGTDVKAISGPRHGLKLVGRITL